MDVAIKINSIEDGEENVVILYGEKSFDGNFNIVNYEESELSGMKGTSTIISYNSDRLSILRSGTVNMDMTFCKGEKLEFPIETEYGFFDCTMTTKEYQIKKLDNGEFCHIEYEMSISGTEKISHVIDITIQKSKGLNL